MELTAAGEAEEPHVAESELREGEGEVKGF